MAKPKKLPKTVPGLTFRLTFVPMINGQPISGVDPISFEWDQSIISGGWHESHVNLGVHGPLADLHRRCRIWWSARKGR